MLAKAPGDRYQSAHDLRTELARVRDLVDRGDLPAERTEPIGWSARLLTGRRGVVYALVAVVAAIAGAGVWWTARTGPPAVAVMPFHNVTGDPQNDYLADGIAQAVRTKLHRAGLHVIPSETVRRHRDSSPTQVAGELGWTRSSPGTSKSKAIGCLSR